MAAFKNQFLDLMDSARSICDQSDQSQWNGEGWSPAIIIGHLVEVDKQVWMVRFELMRSALHDGAPIPQLAWWEPDGIETALKYVDSTLDEVKASFLASREDMLNYLSQLSSSELLASAVHQIFGEITIKTMVEIILNHDREHCETLKSHSV
ncbi:MAG: DinB family protein [Actinobacteria bacterium]|nr:DinB family protein [Actinomycetota bacterium]